MNKWQKADNYMGQNYSDYYVSLVQSRDSDILEQSNFDTALKQLGGVTDTVLVVRSSHWAVGWIEWIAIHESDTDAIATGENIEHEMADYPVLDEEDYCQREYDYVVDTWLNAYSLQDRIDLCKEYNESIFASRNTEVILNNASMYDRLMELGRMELMKFDVRGTLTA